MKVLFTLFCIHELRELYDWRVQWRVLQEYNRGSNKSELDHVLHLNASLFRINYLLWIVWHDFLLISFHAAQCSKTSWSAVSLDLYASAQKRFSPLQKLLDKCTKIIPEKSHEQAGFLNISQ